MVIGNGLLAKAFMKYKNSEDIVIFASGVSNSSELNKEAFKREIELLENILLSHHNELLVYFSSCDVIYADEIGKPYYYHKLEMEEIIKKRCKKYFIFRLPQLIGKSSNKNSLINYFINSILEDKKIVVWKNAYKNLIDVKDVKNMVEFLIQNEESNKTINLINKHYYSVLEIIRILESSVSKKAHIELIDKGFKPEYVRLNILDDLNINFDNNYLQKSIEFNYSEEIIKKAKIV